MPVATRWQRLKSTGLVLIVSSLLTLFALLGLIGAIISHTDQGSAQPAVRHGGLMAPVTDPNDPGPGGGSVNK